MITYRPAESRSGRESEVSPALGLASDRAVRIPRYEQKSFKFLKRTADIGLSLAGLIIASPVYMTLGMAVLVADGGPIFFKQKRIGSDGREFWMYKFRTMRKNAEEALADLLERDEQARREYEETFKLKNDPRLIPGGKFLRATSLDELPQLVNVLLGSMSIVGPRPMLLGEIERMGDRIEIYKRMKPGCAGLWQASGRNDLSYEERLDLNEEYYWHASFRRDFIVIWKTIKAMIASRGAY